MRLLAQLTVAIVLSAPASVNALEVSGGFLSFGVLSSDDYDSDILNLQGGAEFSSTGPLSFQIEAGKFHYDGDTYYDFGTIHLLYDISPATTIGGFLGVEDWEDEDWRNLGLEVRSDFSDGSVPIQIQAVIMRSSEIDGPGEDDVFSLAAYANVAPGWELGAHAAVSNGTDDVQNIGVGAKYSHQSGAFVRLGLDKLTGDNEYESVSVKFGFNFGGGTTMAGRSWNDLFPNY